MFEEMSKYLADIDEIEKKVGKLESVDRLTLMFLAIVEIFKLEYSTYKHTIIKKYEIKNS